MEIIIEYSFVINFFVNSLILKLTGLFLKEPPRLWMISALIGSIVAIILPLYNLSWALKIVITLAMCSLMVCISFQVKSFKKFLIYFCSLFASTFLFGGACYALSNLIGSFPLFVVAIVVMVIYIITKIIVKVQQRKSMIEKFTYQVTLVDNGKTFYEEGYLDSGNVLYDTLTKKPIILVTFDVFHKLYSNINYINAVTKNYDKNAIKDGHFVQIKGVGSSSSILVFRVDEVHVGKDKCYKDVALGLSFSGFDKSFGKRVLLNQALI